MQRIRLSSAVAVSAASLLLLSGCAVAAPTPAASDDTSSDSAIALPSDIKKSGKIRVGVAPDFPPLEYLDPDTNKLTGMDIDLQKKIGETLGVEIEVVESPFDQLINSLKTGRVDIVMSGISDTVERQETMDFVDYYNSAGRLFTQAKRAGEFKNDSDICGKTLTVSGKTDYYEQVKQLSKEVCVSAGKAAINILPTDGSAAAQLQVEQGRADLAVMGAENFAYNEKTNPGKFAAVYEPLKAKPFGVAIKKGSTELADAVLAALQAMVADGSYQKILEDYNLGGGAMTPAINGVKP